MGDLLASTDNPFDMAEDALLNGGKGDDVINIYVGEQLPDDPNYPVRVELSRRPVTHILHLDPRYCSSLSPGAAQVREEMAQYRRLVEQYRDGVVAHSDAYTQTPRVWSVPRATQTVPTPTRTKAVHVTQTILQDSAPSPVEVDTALIPDDTAGGGAAGAHSRPGTSSSRHSVTSTASLARPGEEGDTSITGSVASLAQTNDPNETGGGSDAASDAGTVMTMMTTATTMTAMTAATTMTAGSLNSLGSLADGDDGEGLGDIGGAQRGETGQTACSIDPEILFERLCQHSSAFHASLLLAEDILNQTSFHRLYAEYDGRDIAELINRRLDEASGERGGRGGREKGVSGLDTVPPLDPLGTHSPAAGDVGALELLQLPEDDNELFYTPLARGTGKPREAIPGHGTQPLELHSLWDFYTPVLAGMTVTAVEFAPDYGTGEAQPSSLAPGYGARLRAGLGMADTRTPLLAVGYASGVGGGAERTQGQDTAAQPPPPPDMGLVVVWHRNTQRPFALFSLRSGVSSLAWQPEAPGMIAVGTRSGEVSIFVCRAGAETGPTDAAGFSIPAMSSGPAGGVGGAGSPSGQGAGTGGQGVDKGRHVGAVWGLGWTRGGAGERERGKRRNALHQTDDEDSSVGTDLLLSISADGRVIERSLRRNLESHEILQLVSTKSHPASNGGVGIGASSMSRRLASGTAIAVSPADPGTYLLGTDSGSIHRASRTYTEQYLDTYDGNGHTNTVSGIEWCPFAVQDTFASCSATEGSVKLWTTESNDAVFTLVAEGGGRGVQEQGTRLTCMAWCPFSPTVLLTGSSAGVVAVWDLSVSLTTPVFQVGVSDPGSGVARESVTCLAFSPNSPTVAAGMSGGRVVVLRMSGIETPVLWTRLLPADVLARGAGRVRALVTSTDE